MSDDIRLQSPLAKARTSTRRRSSSSKKRKKRQRRTTGFASDSSSSSDEEEKLHQSIRTKAIRNHLSTTNVRNIIKNVVTNPLVLSAVQQRADYVEKTIQQEKDKVVREVLGGSPEGRKMTRTRARQLNKTPLNIQDLNCVLPDKQVVQLLDGDISDEATEEEAGSENGDVEYRPNYNELSDEDYSTTTCSDFESQPSQSEAEDMVEGVFKKPRGLPIPRPKQEIARRTRSRLSLKSTTIETLQEGVLPDPPENLSNTEIDGDEPWLEFLDQFQKPLPETVEAEEGEETDPEYVAVDVAEEENDTSLLVSKREANLLLKDILEEVEETAMEDLRDELAIRFDETPNPPLPTIRIREPPPPPQQQPKKTKKEPAKTVIEAPSLPDPQLLSVDGVEPQGLILPTPNLPPTFSMIHSSDNKLYLLPTFPLPPESKPESAYVQINVYDDMPTILAQINRQRLINYQHEFNEKVGYGGWTARGLRIFHRQLLAHIQLLGQMFVQTFSHPRLWNLASTFKQLLESFVEAARESPILSLLCWNLNDMLEICNEWESELNVENEENVRYVMEVDSKFFHPRVLERMTSHKAFIFPEVLPRHTPIDNGGFGHYPHRRGILLSCMWQANCLFKPYNSPEARKALQRYETVTGHRITMRRYDEIVKEAKIVQFMLTGEIPGVNRVEMRMESYEAALPPILYTAGTLPKAFRPYYFKKVRELPAKMRKEAQQEAKQEENTKVTVDYSSFKAAFEMPTEPIYYGMGSVPSESECGVAVGGGEGGNGESELVVKERLAGREKETKRKKNGLSKSTLEQMIKEALRNRKSQRPKRTNAHLLRIRTRKQLTRHLHMLLTRFDLDYQENVIPYQRNSISKKLLNFFKEFDIFLRLFFLRYQTGPLGVLKLPKLAVFAGLEEVEQKFDPSTEAAAEGGGETERDPLFAWRFMDVLVEMLGENNFHRFLETMTRRKFNSVLEFYLNLEELLSEFPQLLNMFLTHLMPCHVSRVGDFLHDQMAQVVSVFEGQLHTYMDQRDVQMQQIYQLMHYLPDDNTICMKTIKCQFCPVVNGNPLLRNWFLQLFSRKRLKNTQGRMLEFPSSCSGILRPVDLLDRLTVRREEENGDRELPPLNLQLSDTESDSDGDSVECVGVEYIHSPNRSTHTLFSPELESQTSIDADTQERGGDVDDMSICLTDIGSDNYHTDYTE